LSDRDLPGIQPDGKKKGFGCLGCLGVLAGFVILFGGCTALMSMNQEEYDPNNEYEVISQCEARIEEQLKSPATAKFDSTATGSGTWTVRGTVDAENSFGATVRSNYECTVVVNDNDTLTTRINYIE
jgi:hypothetical protein